MKIFAFLSLMLFSLKIPVPLWHNNFNEAQQIAIGNNKLIVLNFSGSDWCIPCMRTRKEIFETAVFTNFADANLVLVNADFPRNSKNKLSKDQVKLNEALADKYNATGIFPLTILMTSAGKILKQWQGFPDLKPEEFIQQIKTYSYALN